MRASTATKVLPRKPYTKVGLRTFWRSELRTTVMSICDVFVILLAAQVSWMARFDLALLPPDYMLVTIIGCVGWLLVVSKSSVYKIAERQRLWSGIRKVALSWIYVATSVTFLAFMAKSGHEFSRLWAFGWFAGSLLGLVGVHFIWNLAIQQAERAGHFAARIAVVGNNFQAVSVLIEQVHKLDPSTIIAGVFGIDSALVDERHRPCFDGYTLDHLIHDYHTIMVDSVWLALDWDQVEEIECVRARISVLPCEIHTPILPVVAAFPGRAVGQHIGIPTVTLGRRPMSSGELMLKRAEDVILGSLFLFMAAPILLLIAISIKLDSAGPVLFRQKRHGFANGTFSVFKFRTMQHVPEGENPFVQATKGDPRVTRIGRILRRTSLDELPQLLNVLLGDMSLVGPRPHPVDLSHQALISVDAYLARHKMKPGITGWAQIHGLRGETDTLDKMIQRVEFDRWYVDHWSVWLDLRIVLMTIPALFDKNAY